MSIIVFESTTGGSIPAGTPVVLDNGRVRAYNAGVDLTTAKIIGVIVEKSDMFVFDELERNNQRFILN